MIEEHRRDSQGFRIEFIENVVRIVRAVVVSNSCMITPDYEMGAAIVLPDDCVKYGLSRAGIAHRRGIDRQKSPRPGKVVFEHRLVTAHSNIRGNVVRFCLAHQRMKQKPSTTSGHT
jgi:hypothetical protein